MLYAIKFIYYSCLNSETFLILIIALSLILYLDIVYGSLENTKEIYPLISNKFIKYKLFDTLYIIPASTINGYDCG